MPFDITKLDSQTIIFGGLTLVSMGLITLVGVVVRAYFNQSKLYYNHTNDVIKENTGALINIAASNMRIADSNDQLAKVIEKFHELPGA